MQVFSSNATEAAELIHRIDVTLCGILLMSLLILVFSPIKTPYGRYSSGSFGPTVPGIVDWVMHGTALVAVNICLLQTDIGNLTLGSSILLTLYCAHYINRAHLCFLSLKQQIYTN